ncbi:hypothetical protein RISK_003993 [Rhodopirellula islandica]|uniref:Uncharacterized protein n=1 Tax=Rhodopirellula islandica TaxID=595434 RepID=A0A0J1EES7_RHOIS|nr:hypothetical protein RISK_003993 [Rhodopirellula islandica]
MRAFSENPGEGITRRVPCPAPLKNDLKIRMTSIRCDGVSNRRISRRGGLLLRSPSAPPAFLNGCPAPSRALLTLKSRMPP